MTTGRINQVTIVRRGWPTGAVFHAPERLSKLLGGTREGAARREVPPAGGREGPPCGKSAFPLSVPQGIRPHAPCARCGRCGIGAPGGGLAVQHQPFRRPLPVVATCCSDLRRWPAASHPQNPSSGQYRGAASHCPQGITSTPCSLSSRFRGVRPPPGNPPACKAGACKRVQRAT